MKGVFLDTASMGDGLDFSHLTESLANISYHPVTQKNQVRERLAGAEVAIVNKVVLGKTEFEQSPDLKLVAVTATGTNNIDLAAAKAAGVRVCNVIRYGRPTIVQHTFSLILALSNNLMKYHADVQSGRWNKSSVFCLMDHPIQELEGKTLGIIGFGDLGQGVAKMAEAFGMHVILGARPGQSAGVEGGYPRLALSEFLSRIDVLSLHCLLSDNTRNLIDAAALAQMKSTALLVNVARGGLVDELALANALRAGKLAGAAMDVLTEEPPRNGNVLLSADIPNLIITPHCAWASQQARQRIVDKTAQNIKQFIDGSLDRFVV